MSSGENGTTARHVPLGVLDLIPRVAGDDEATALRKTIELVRRSEELGYGRYWFAEHHNNPGVLGSSPAVQIALVAPHTSTIRLGSAGVQFGHRTPLSTVEEFGLIDALYPGRLDLGIGRSISRPAPDAASGPPGGGAGSGRPQRRTTAEHAPNGLLLPAPYDPSAAVSPERLEHHLSLLQQPGAYAPDYAAQIADVLALLDGSYVSPVGIEAIAAPGQGAQIEVWVLGGSAGTSAAVAGANGLPFAAGYHHTPGTVVEAVEAYRAAFQPSARLAEPYVAVSADVVVGRTHEEGEELASGYPAWVRSIRRAEGAIAYPAPADAAALRWSEEDRILVQDRVDTQFRGDASEVADRLEQLQEATGADELSLTTITHDHQARLRSYELIASEWARRSQ